MTDINKYPKCEENSHDWQMFNGLGIKVRTCQKCGYKEYRYTGETLGTITDWKFDGWDYNIVKA